MMDEPDFWEKANPGGGDEEEAEEDARIRTVRTRMIYLSAKGGVARLTLKNPGTALRTTRKKPVDKQSAKGLFDSDILRNHRILP
jgi:hypothetical protein